MKSIINIVLAMSNTKGFSVCDARYVHAQVKIDEDIVSHDIQYSPYANSYIYEATLRY